MKIFKKIILLLVVGITSIYCLNKIEREIEINNFFSSKEDLKWANEYLDKKKKFCESSWPSSTEVKTKDRITYYSPSESFRVESPKKILKQSDRMIIFNNKVNQAIVSLEYDHTPSLEDIRWVRNERYFVYLKTAMMDEDFVSPEIYIINLKTKKIIYFFEPVSNGCLDEY